MKVNILGAEYTVEFRDKKDDLQLDGHDGYCDTSIRVIVVEQMTPDEGSKKDLVAYAKQVLRHELVHAFLYESGLDSCTTSYTRWATNEEMIDWMSIQLPKILKACEEAQAL